jgi:uncharacterized protein (TIGR03435 family)
MLAFLLACAALCAQSNPAPAEGPLSFEVASVKVVPFPDAAHPMRLTGAYGPGQFTWEGAALRSLIVMAYDIPGLQWHTVVGMPPIRDYFEVVAKVPEGTDRAQFCRMLQNLLAERFGVETHYVEKEVPSYDLEVAKGGPKLKDAEKPSPDAPPQSFTWPADGWPFLPPGKPSIGFYGRRGVVLSHLAARMSGIPDLIRQLAQISEQPILDKTGLTGIYDFTMDFIAPGTPTPSQDSADPSGAASEPGPDLAAALERQLGLKLASGKTVVKVLVVDKFNALPTEN